MTVRSNGKICGVSQIKLTDNRLRTGVKNLPDRFAELLIADLACAEGIYHYRNGLCNADCVSELNLTFIGKLCRDNILRDVTAVISRAAVNLCRVLTAERTAAVTRKSSVGIDDNFSACKTCVTDGTADYKSTCRIDENLCILIELLGNDRLDNILDDILANLTERYSLVVLGRNYDSINALSDAVIILDGNLSFAVGSEIFESAVLSDLGKLFGKLMSKRNRKRHKLGRLVARIAEHHTLVSRADLVVVVVLAVALLEALVNAHSDIRTLSVDRCEHSAGAAVKAAARVIVADIVDNLSDDCGDIHITFGGNLTHNVNHTCCSGCLTRNMSVLVLL